VPASRIESLAEEVEERMDRGEEKWQPALWGQESGGAGVSSWGAAGKRQRRREQQQWYRRGSTRKG
jgi:hypothetical protein